MGRVEEERMLLQQIQLPADTGQKEEQDEGFGGHCPQDCHRHMARALGEMPLSGVHGDSMRSTGL